MNKRSLLRIFYSGLALAVTCALSQGTSVQAGGVTGTAALADIGTPTVSPTNSILTATTFNLGSLVTTSAETGNFLTYVPPGQAVGTGTIVVGVPTSFMLLAPATIGSFSSSGIVETIGINSVTFNIAGTFTPGADFLGLFTPGLAAVTISFTQSGGPGTAISDSASIAVLPEPASLGLLGVGMTGFLAFRRFFRRTPVA
jgi:hypothetical protein